MLGVTGSGKKDSYDEETHDLDLLAEPEYQALKDFFDAQPNI